MKKPNNNSLFSMDTLVLAAAGVWMVYVLVSLIA
jgi:hypothetical protein